MNRSIWGLFLALTVFGCTTTPQVKLSEITLTVWNDSYSKKTNYQLTLEGKQLLESILDRKPDHNINTAVEIDLTGVLISDGKKYVVEPDRILFLGVNFTKIWEQKRVRQDLINNSMTQSGD